MIQISITDHIHMIAFWLAFSRWIGILFQIPLFDGPFIPGIVKIFSAILISYAFFPFVEESIKHDILLWGPDRLLLLTIYQVLTGLLIGLCIKSIMGIFIAAGSIMTQSMGFGSVNYFDPTFSDRVGPMEKLLQVTIVVLILSSGALIPMFKGAMNSFHTINLSQGPGVLASSQFYLSIFKDVFISALVLAAPLLFANFFMNFILGLIARLVPQMNVLMLSFVVNIGMGLVVFIAISEELWVVGLESYITILGRWFQWVS